MHGKSLGNTPKYKEMRKMAKIPPLRDEHRLHVSDHSSMYFL